MTRGRRWLGRLGALLGMGLVLAGCSFPTWLVYEAPDITPPGLAATREFTPTVAPVETSTPVPPTSLPCAYVWGYKDLGDETARLQDRLVEAGLGRVEAVQSAYGETCLDSLNNTVIEFHATQNDFHFAVPVGELGDREALGKVTRQILDIVAKTAEDDPHLTPPGLVELVYGDGKEELRIRFLFSSENNERLRGLDGTALFEAMMLLNTADTPN